jgi:NAD(P)H-flavin reductase
VISHERRRFDIAVMRVVPDRPVHFVPGQSVALEPTSRRRGWRYYSMANAPRPDHSLDFHVRLIDGGMLSQVIVRSLRVGDWVRMGAPIGTLTLDQESDRDILLVAGSTGLAPIKSMLEQIARRPSPPRVHLFFGAQTADALYDLEDLNKRAAEAPWLTVVPTVSAGGDTVAAGGIRAEQGMLPDVVARYGRWTEHDAYVCGPNAMVAATADRLAQLGLPRNRIRLETFVDS